MSSTRGRLLGQVLLVLLPVPFHGNPVPPTVELFSKAGRGLEPVRTETNRCSDSEFDTGMYNRQCGSPLSSPCFNFSRCAVTPTAQDEFATFATASSSALTTGDDTASGVKIYVFDNECSLANSDSISSDARDEGGEALRAEALYKHNLSWIFRNAAREAGVLAATYESACIFIHVGWAESEPCPVNAPLWNDGSNHVMVNFGDNGRERRRKVATSFAVDAASNMHSCLYRSGYDISLPLFPKNQFHELANIPPSGRRFFLTTKGTVYPSGHGSEERQSVVPLHDESQRVIVSMHCLETHGEHLLPEFLEYCEQLKGSYGNYDYDNLMNTTFGLIPAGRSPATFRLAEVMSAGAIPVFVARDVVLPFREQIDWPSFSFSFPPERVQPDLMRTLKALPPRTLDDMQRKSLEAYGKMFRKDDSDALVGPPAFTPSAQLVIDTVLQRVGYRSGR